MPTLPGMLDVLDTRFNTDQPTQPRPTFWRSLWRFAVWWSVLLAAALSLGLASPGAL
jgi:hypothetical protein